MEALATLLARAFLVYGLVLGLFTAYGGHLAVLIGVIFVVANPARARWFRLACEIFYGLLNPIIYLLVLRFWLTRYEPDFWRSLPLLALAWTLLVLIWGTRLAGAVWRRSASFDTTRRALVLATITCVVLYGLKDAAVYARATSAGATPPGGGDIAGRLWLLTGLALLYVIPLVLLGDDLRRDSAASGFLLFREPLARATGTIIAGAAIAFLVVAWWRPSDAAARREVLSRKSAILEAASEFGVDPAAIASILYVTQRDQITPLRRQIEGLAMALWLKDPNSDFVGAAFDVSIGVAQIKPVTAQTASQLVAFSGKTNPYTWSKQYRDVPELEWPLPPDLTQRVTIPWGSGAPKASVVAALLNDRDNLRACAMILAIYQLQWATASSSAAISGRPDILATLFQIGFERSHPKASPRNNAFGRQVQAAYDSEWMRAAFR